jgi:histone arginine demethylase JMJD6
VEIDRRSGLELAEFETEYVARTRPVILTDATAHWDARSKWSFENFEQRFADKEVRFDDKAWRVGSFIRELRGSSGVRGKVPYLKMVKLDEQFHELRADIGDLKLAKHNRLASRLLPRTMRIDRGFVAVFVGTKGSGFSTLHWDLGYLHVFISQIVGDKEAILFRPEDTPFLYANPEQPNLSTLPDPFEVDLAKFPAFAKANAIRVTVKQGETLFLPGGWWHATYIDHPNIAIAESTLDHFNWRVRKDWFMKQFRETGVAGSRRRILGAYMDAVDLALTQRDRFR